MFGAEGERVDVVGLPSPFYIFALYTLVEGILILSKYVKDIEGDISDIFS